MFCVILSEIIDFLGKIKKNSLVPINSNLFYEARGLLAKDECISIGEKTHQKADLQ